MHSGGELPDDGQGATGLMPASVRPVVFRYFSGHHGFRAGIHFLDESVVEIIRPLFKTHVIEPAPG